MERSDYEDTVVVRRRVEEPVEDFGDPAPVRHVAPPPRRERGYAEQRSAAPVAAAEWPVRWSGVWVGALVAITAAAILGLVASAIGDAQAAAHVTSWGDYSRAALIYSIFNSLLAFFLGGFLAVKVAGVHGFEPALLHGALTWLVVFPALLLLGAIGAGHFFGNFSSGLIGPATWITPGSTSSVDPVAAAFTKNIAVSALFAVVMGLLGSLTGGWLAAEPFSFGRRGR